MIYYINAYAPDTRALHITTARVRELDPEAVIIIASDPAAPVPVAIPGTVAISPPYPRGGNLRGAACVLGMLDTMEAVLSLEKKKHLVKLDADTYLNAVDWLDPSKFKDKCKGSEPDFVAMERADAFAVSGDCYRISLFGIRAAKRIITQRVKEAADYDIPGGEDLPEDVSISEAVMRAGLPVYTVPFFRGLHRGISYTLPTEEHRRASVIHCGEPLANGQRAPREMVYLRLQVMWQITHQGQPAPAPTFR